MRELFIPQSIGELSLEIVKDVMLVIFLLLLQTIIPQKVEKNSIYSLLQPFPTKI